jgi:catechol 2,3-dioxygenase-like lactoylglutathione lyase family enzyme
MVAKHVSGIDHIALQLSDLEAGVSFFRDLLGFKTCFEVSFEDLRIVNLKAGKIEIEMWERPDGDHLGKPPTALSRPGVNHIAITVNHLEEVLQGVQAHGCELIKDIYQPTEGIREAVILGPDNLEIQFVEQNIPLLIWRSIKGDFK